MRLFCATSVLMMDYTVLVLALSSLCLGYNVARQLGRFSECRTDGTPHHLICTGFLPTDVPPPHVTSVTIREVRFNVLSFINGIDLIKYIEWPNVATLRLIKCHIRNELYLPMYIFAGKGRLILTGCDFETWDDIMIVGPFRREGLGLMFYEIEVVDSSFRSVFWSDRMEIRIPNTKSLELVNVTCPYNLRVVFVHDMFVNSSRSLLEYVSLVNVKCTIAIELALLQQLKFTASEHSAIDFLKTLRYNFTRLTSLDISDNRIPFHENLLTEETTGTRPYFPALKEFYARKVIYSPCTISIAVFNASCYAIKLNLLEIFNDSFIGCFDPVTLTLLDLAHNSITSIDDSFVNAFTALQIFDASSNLLHTIGGGGDLYLKPLTSLGNLYAANNQIHTVKVDAFAYVNNLSVIDLSNNTLGSIMFKMEHLLKLRVLLLDDNNITYLYQTSLTLLNSLIAHQRISSNTTIQLGLSRNPLSCICLAKPFITWILHNKAVMTSWPLYCHQSGRVRRIGTAALHEASELCHWEMYIIIAGFLSATSLSISIAFVVYCIRRWKNLQTENRIRDLILNYNNTKDGKGFPVFLSFCSEDADFIMDNVFDDLNNRLQELLGTHKRCIAFGDADFRPGSIVIEEMVRCLGICDVVVLCVSNKFLRSPWCADETRIAHYYRKPVVLMFLEEVDKKLLNKSIVMLYFITSCRAKWTVKANGNYELQPAWGTFCESLIDRMSEARADNSEEQTEV